MRVRRSARLTSWRIIGQTREIGKQELSIRLNSKRPRACKVRDRGLMQDQARTAAVEHSFVRRMASTMAILVMAIVAHVWFVPRVDVPRGVDPATSPIAPETTTTHRLPETRQAPAVPSVEPAAAQATATPSASRGDSSTIPDTTYPAPDAIVGTSGRLKPAVLLRSSREPAAERAPESRGVDRPAVAGPPTTATPGSAPSVPDASPVPPADEASGDAAAGPAGDSEGIETIPTPPVPDVATEIAAEELVHLVVEEYRAAYERLDASAAKNIWPSVDARALRHAFNQLSEQRLNFESCGVSISGDVASARCRGQAEYLPKVGSRRALVKAGEWVFDLARQDTAWHIVSARIQ
jgi:hypothetical protein